MRGRPAHLVDGSVERARQELARHFGPSKLKVDEKDCEAFRNDASEAAGRHPYVRVVITRFGVTAN